MRHSAFPESPASPSSHHLFPGNPTRPSIFQRVEQISPLTSSTHARDGNAFGTATTRAVRETATGHQTHQPQMGGGRDLAPWRIGARPKRQFVATYIATVGRWREDQRSRRLRARARCERRRAAARGAAGPARGAKATARGGGARAPQPARGATQAARGAQGPDRYLALGLASLHLCVRPCPSLFLFSFIFIFFFFIVVVFFVVFVFFITTAEANVVAILIVADRRFAVHLAAQDVAAVVHVPRELGGRRRPGAAGLPAPQPVGAPEQRRRRSAHVAAQLAASHGRGQHDRAGQRQ